MSKLKVGLICIFLTLAIPLVLVFAFRGYVVDAIYKNVEDLVDGEMPPTVTSFQSAPDTVSIIGGGGEGLNCSLPSWTNGFFDGTADKNGKVHLVLQRFRQACVFHDLCYRHGLATYGYNQNDCDRILQNEAYRLCRYIRNGSTENSSDRCQADSKLVLAGVNLGGANSYRAWGKSTFFEFESDPARSSEFRASRIVDHPFKFLNSVTSPDKYKDEADQIVLTFENMRSNFTVKCVTCQSLILQSDRSPRASDEMISAGLSPLPQALLGQELTLADTRAVWLPPRRHHAAPHLLVDSDGKHHLIWMSRKNNEDTISCVVLSDAATLLTSTLPRLDLCNPGAGSRLKTMEIDMYATSPLPMELPGAPAGDHIFATGITAQTSKDYDLGFCSRSATRKIVDDDDRKARCTRWDDENVAKGSGLGAFQNFAVIRPGQQIYFARDVGLSSPLTNISKRWWGDTYSSDGAMLKLDVSPPTTPTGPAVPTNFKVTHFSIDDRFDPMMPISRDSKDFRFLSLEAQESGSKTLAHIFDFKSEPPAIRDVIFEMNNNDAQLDRSWALRPVLVLETKDSPPQTKLIFSRSALESGRAVGPREGTETLSLDTLIFERDVSSDGPFKKAGGAKCTVKYTFKKSLSGCNRVFEPQRAMRSSPAAKLLGSQLLIGKVAANAGSSLVFVDACMKAEPIVLRPKTERPGEFEPVSPKSALVNSLRREVTCEPLNSNDYVSKPIKPEPTFIERLLSYRN
ncbi:hypothetical protein [Afipia sp. GAS231]|uniref:hypothetical protein n=1 Tax=Afipia sp. GAS231 TaxID=1882747 RepID=UPI00087C671C|nr:hypothetical protein [Afipia sp. GAS231]SDP04371.1 hypothetical protein SAMN05444050_5685 [Afipia sp. GAS231]